MKTNRKLQLLAVATLAMLAINPAARAQTPAPLSDEELLHALATGQVFTGSIVDAPTSSQLGAGGGDDEKVSHASTASSQGGAYYFQGPTASQIGVGGGNDDSIRNGYTDSDADGYGVVASYGAGLYLQGSATASYGGAFYLSGTALPGGVQYIDNDCDGIRGATSQPANGSVAEEFPEWVRSNADQRALNGVYPGLYLQGSPTIAQIGVGGGDDTRRPSGVAGICDDADNCIHNGGAIYNATTGSPSLRSTQGSALYRSTASSLYGESLPGDQLTDAHLDAMILDALGGGADTSDNCPVAPMPR